MSTLTISAFTPFCLGNPTIGELMLQPGATVVDAEQFERIAVHPYVQQLLDAKIIRIAPDMETSEDIMLAQIAKADEPGLIAIARRDGRPRCRAAMNVRWQQLVSLGQYNSFAPTHLRGSHFFQKPTDSNG